MSSDSRFDYLEYINSIEDPEVREYLKRFYQDYYQGHHVREGSVIPKDSDIRKEATRNLHNYERELFYQKGEVTYLPENFEEFMEAACDEWGWERELKMHGFEAALKMITEQTLKDLDNKYLDKSIVLMRYYQQRDRLRRMENSEKRKNGKKQKKKKS